MRKKEAEGCALIIVLILFGLYTLFSKGKEIWNTYPEYQWLFVIGGIGIAIFLAYSLEKRNAKKKKERLTRMILSDWWYNLSPREFEHELAELYKYLGYKTKVTQASRDGGIDIIAKDGSGHVYIQCKVYSKPVGVKPVRELYGVMCADGVSRGIVACIGEGFTSGATDFAKRSNITLIGAYEIVEMSKEKLKHLYEDKV